MQPPQLLFDAPTRFIKVNRAFCSDQFLLASLIDRLNLLDNLIAYFHKGPFAHALTI